MKRCLTFYMLIGVIFLSQTNLYAMGTSLTKGDWRVEPGLFIGFGFKNHHIGDTTDGDSIKLSGGGGLGGGITLGYGFSEKVDLEGTFGFQTSSLRPKVTNASGDFDRNFFLGSFKYKIPLKGNLGEEFSSAIKIGGGIGLYNGGKLNLGLRSVGLGDWQIDYDSALGTHLTLEFESYFWHVSGILGLKVYQIKYKANSFTLNSNSVPVSFLSSDFKNLDGSSIDLYMSFQFGKSGRNRSK